MHLRIHLTILLIFLAAHSVTSSIESSSLKQNGGKLKATDSDLYIDDEGDDEIPLQDEASGSGPIKSVDTEDEEDEEGEEDEEEEEGIEEDKEEIVARTPAAPTSTTSAPVKEVEKRVNIKEDPILPPKVSPVAERIQPTYEDDEEENGSGHGHGGHSGDRITEDTDDDEEEDYDDNFDRSVTGETDPTTRVEEPKRKPEEPKKPDTMVPPSSPPPKSPKGADGSSAVGKLPAREENQIPDVVTPPPAVPGSNEMDNDVHILDHKTEDRPTSFFAQPGILAAVIGGAVVGLLCAILLVMFIVYRMRKKDEGSYVLDEPKRNSPNSHPYNKNSREFYA